MAKAKKRGPKPRKGLAAPAALVGVRCSKGLLVRLDQWRTAQGDKPGRPEAARRLMEQALSTHSLAGRTSARSSAQAADMAGTEIDRRADQSASDKERASRKRRLLKGPKEVPRYARGSP